MTLLDRMRKEIKEQQENRDNKVSSKSSLEHIEPKRQELKITATLSDEAQAFADDNFGPVDKETVDTWIEEAKGNPHIAVSIPDNYFGE